MNTPPRFQFPFDAPPPRTIGDRLLSSATHMAIQVWRSRDSGELLIEVEVKAACGADPAFERDADSDTIEVPRSDNAAALAFARDILSGFASAGKEGSE
jgi:hypothetical protein